MCTLTNFSSDCNNALLRCLGWAGADKLLTPLIPGLLDLHSDLLDTLITTKDTPVPVLKLLAQKLFERDDDQSTHLLLAMHQRHLDLIQSSINEMVGSDDELKAKLEKKLMSLTTVSRSYSYL